MNRTQNSPTGRLIIVSGPSGVGKGTLLRKLFRRWSATPGKSPLIPSVSATTRAPRVGEKDGVDYHFLSREEFLRRKEAGEFLECFEVYPGGDWYGTLRETVADALKRGVSVVLEIDVKGAMKVLEEYPDAQTVFILPPNSETLRKRLAGRGSESPASLEKRLAQAEAEIARSDCYRHRVVNDRLDDALAELERILDRPAKLEN